MNKKAVTPILGMMFILMFATLALSLLQTYQVPKWSKSEELKHFNRLVSELSELPSMLTSGKQTTLKIDAGLDYTDYPLLITPPTASSTIYSEKRNLTLAYNGLLPNGTTKTFKLSSNTSAIYVEPHYFYMQPEEIIFEHGIVFRKGETYFFPVTKQILFVGNKITIPVIYANISPISSGSTVNLRLTPIEIGYTFATKVNIEFETDFPEFWNDTLNDWRQEMLNQGYSVEYSITTQNGKHLVNVSAEGEKGFIVGIPKWYVSTTVIETIKVTSKFLVINPKIVNITVDSVVKVDVWVFDQTGAPASDIKVNYSLSGDHLVLISSSPVTDQDGHAYFYFRGEKVGTGTIEFSANSATMEVPYEVVSIGGGGGGVVIHKVVLNPTQDAYVSERYKKKNYGDKSYLKVGRSVKERKLRTFIQFNLSSLPSDAKITSAKLRLYMYDSTVASYKTFVLYRVTEQWDELEITWKNQPDTSNDIIAYQVIPPGIEDLWIEWDITNEVQAIVNGTECYGWMIKDTEPLLNEYATFYSKEYTTQDFRPQLVVYYYTTTG